MKNAGKCTKCGSPDVLRVPGGVGPSGVGNYVGVGLLSAAKVTRFVCGQCGFTEEWIESPADLELLRKRFGE